MKYVCYPHAYKIVSNTLVQYGERTLLVTRTNKPIMILASSGVRQGHVREGHVKGFTLIELLVVIAIIGILSSVVLASLNTARNKGADAAIKANIDSARAQAELYYDATSNSYAGVCTTAGTGIGAMTTGAAAGSSATVVNYASAVHNVETATQAVCVDTASTWVIQAPLKATSGTYFCADNTGTSTVKSAVLAANALAC